MALIVTPIIGKRSLEDRVIVSRLPDGEASEALRMRQAGAATVAIRLRPELNTPDWRALCSSRVRQMLGERMDDLLRDGETSFTTRRRFDSEENRTVVDECVTLGFGEERIVTAQAATLLLDHPLYGFMLEEVEREQRLSVKAKGRGRMTIEDMAQAAGEAGLDHARALAAKDAEIEALRQRLSGNPPPQPASGDDTDGAADGGAPPPPKAMKRRADA